MPEEINRLVTDALADLLLTPEPDADENLRREGVAADAHPPRRQRDDRHARREPRARAGARACRDRSASSRARYVYVTLHRPSNVDERDSLAAIVACLLDVLAARRRSCSRCTRARASGSSDFGLRRRRSLARRREPVEPVGYLDSIGLAEARRVRAHRLGRAAGGDDVPAACRA